MFDAGTRCVVVVGAQWGDEGKGKLVDVLAERADFVVRYQGGANAGHTVVIGERPLRPAPDPVGHPALPGHLHHRQRRRARRPSSSSPSWTSSPTRSAIASGRLFVSDRAHLVLPLHKLLDVASEKKPEHRHHGTRHRALLRGQVRPPRHPRRRTCATSTATGRTARPRGSSAPITSCTRWAAPSARRSTSTWRCWSGSRRGCCRIATDTGLLVHRAVREGRACPARGRAGRAARRRSRHLSVRHVVQHHRRRRRGRCRHRPDRDPRGARRGEGVHHARRQRTASHRGRTGRVGNSCARWAASSAPPRDGPAAAAGSTPAWCATPCASTASPASRSRSSTCSTPSTRCPVGTGYDLDGETCEGMPADVEALDRVTAGVRGAAGVAAARPARRGSSPTCPRRRARTSTGSRNCPVCPSAT